MHDRLTKLLEPVAGLFGVDSVEAMALRILGAVLVLLAAFWISRTTQRYLVRRLQRQDTGGAQAIQTYRRIVQAVVWVIGGAIALHTLGIDLTHIFTAGGLFTVALAFAMKDLAENLVSGLLLSLGGRSSAAMCSELNEAIWWALKDAGIVIAFPQLDVHVGPDALSGASR